MQTNAYVGGSRLISIPDLDFVHVGIGFETGGWHDDDLVPACVLVALLGGGDSFSAGTGIDQKSGQTAFDTHTS